LADLVRATDGAQPASGAVSRGRQRASGTGRADGGDVGPAGGADDPRGPRFDTPVAPGGYAWWYVDGLSDDGRHGLTIIAFVGSVFSPYYAWRRARSGADPEDHVAINVALYGAAGHRWAMTERGRSGLLRDRATLEVGPSRIGWRGDSLEIEIDEVTVPIPSRLRGRVRFHPSGLTGARYAIDGGGRHHWWPVAPHGRIEVEFERPALRWSGVGYLDANRGEEPLEAGFARWDWSRAALSGAAAVLYDAAPRRGPPVALALRIAPDGQVEPFAPPRRQSLPTTLWRVARSTQCEDGVAPAVLQTLEDAPFYARSLIRTRLLGETVTAFHESLSLDRFAQPWVRLLLPFRMPRRAR
jgi:carotenoid 1,2-hydratase